MTDTTEVLRKAQGALRLTTMLRQLGGMLPGVREVLLAAVEAADETLTAIDEALSTPAAADGEPVAWRHSHTHCLYETEEEVQLADGDEWAEPLYLAATPSAVAAQWQPIETVKPPEDTPVWLWSAEDGVWIGTFSYPYGDGWCFTKCYRVPHIIDGKWQDDDAEWDDDYAPTHWMPLPPAPTTTPGKSGQEGGGA